MNPHLPHFVQELLDQGRDPLAEPRTQEWLLAHPEALAAFAELRARLQSLRTPTTATTTTESTPPGTAWRRPVAWLTVAATAAALVVATAVALTRGEPDAGPAAAAAAAAAAVIANADGDTDAIAPRRALPAPELATTGRVLQCRTTATDIRGLTSHHRVVVRLAPGAQVRRTTHRLDGLRSPPRSPTIRVCAVTTRLEGLLP